MALISCSCASADNYDSISAKERDIGTFRWLERFFTCYNPFEMRKDYKEIFLTMWVNYKYLDNSFVGQHFEAVCDVITVTMATLKVHKKELQIFSFCHLSKKLSR